MLKRFFDFFVFSSLFIAVCAVLMTYQTAFLFHLPFSFELAGFVFCGSVTSYNFHWYLTPPMVANRSKKLSWNVSNKPIHLVLFIIGLIGAAVFTILLIDHWFWLAITAFVTFLYSAPKIPHPWFSVLRKIAVGKTIFLAFAWAHITSLLPMVMTMKILGPEHIWFVVNRFFFIYAICILFDHRDVAEDRKAGIKSMITYFSEQGVDRLFWFSMLVYFVSTIALGSVLPSGYLIALLVPGIILAFLYYPSKKSYSDYLYYFILDGLMMLSAPLLLLIKFAR